MYTPENKLPPFDFIQRNYREPRSDDPIARWLPHPAVARCVCRILRAQGIPKSDIEDGLRDVYVKAITAFRKGKPVPGDLGGMKNLCAAIARNYVIDKPREAAQREKDGYAGLCDDADEYTPLEYGAEQRDPIDARRQLEVLAQLFREGAMPPGGVEILEGVASRCRYATIGEELGIGEELVRWRMREMSRIYRKRMARLGMLPGMQPLRVIVPVLGGGEEGLRRRDQARRRQGHDLRRTEADPGRAHEALPRSVEDLRGSVDARRPSTPARCGEDGILLHSDAVLIENEPDLRRSVQGHGVSAAALGGSADALHHEDQARVLSASVLSRTDQDPRRFDEAPGRSAHVRVRAARVLVPSHDTLIQVAEDRDRTAQDRSRESKERSKRK